MNYLRNYDNGVFSKYMDKTAGNGGMLVFAEVPFGEYTANQLTSDNPNDVKNSVYSRSAAIERKIEIQSVSYFTEGVFPIITENPNFIFAETAKNKELKGAFIIKNELLFASKEITPEPTNSSSRYQATNWPSVIADCGSSKATYKPLLNL